MRKSWQGPVMAAPLLVLLAGCVGDGDAGPGAQPVNTQPRQATYRCAEAGQITVQRVSGAVQVIDIEGETVTLPPAPPGQFTRFGAEGYALVVEGRDALWMKAGSTPLDCVR